MLKRSRKSIELGFNPYVNWIKDRCLKKNKNVIAVMLGQTGSGKTYAYSDLALQCAKANGTSFSIKNNVAFDFVDLLKKSELECNKKPGTVFLFEEVGAVGSGASSAQWQTKANAFFSSFMQTARHRNQVLLFTTPNFSLLMKQVRMLIHLVGTMDSINRTKKTSCARMKICQTNPVSGKIYMKNMRLTIKGKTHVIKKCTFNLPPKDFLQEYEKVKLKYTKALNQQIIDSSQPKEDKRKSDFDIERLKELLEKGIKRKEIAKIMDVTTMTIWRKMKELNIGQ